MHARALRALFRTILATTAVALPSAWLACGGGETSSGGSTSDGGAIDDALPGCPSALTILDASEGGAGCYPMVRLPCGSDATFLTPQECSVVCNSCTAPTHTCVTRDLDTDAGVISIDCNAITGRRPEGLTMSVGPTDDTGAWLARAAELEAASVIAFARLRAELRSHGAPRRLLDACRRAERDEARHARTMERLARRYGGVPARVKVGPRPARSLEAMATENAREGCVRETFGALMAHAQAARSTDERIRRALRTIAVDETRHAALAWRIDAWTRSRLTGPANARVVASRERERRALLENLDAPADAAQKTLGLPPPSLARQLAAALAASIDRA